MINKTKQNNVTNFKKRWPYIDMKWSYDIFVPYRFVFPDVTYMFWNIYNRINRTYTNCDSLLISYSLIIMIETVKQYLRIYVTKTEIVYLIERTNGFDEYNHNVTWLIKLKNRRKHLSKNGDRILIWNNGMIYSFHTDTSCRMWQICYWIYIFDGTLNIKTVTVYWYHIVWL